MVLGRLPEVPLHAGSRKVPDEQNSCVNPRGSKVEDAVLEARLQPLLDAVLVRRLRYVLLCETRGGALRFIASIVRHPQHPARKPHGFIMALRPALRTEARCPPLTVTPRRTAARVRFRASRGGAAADGPDEAQHQACDRWITRHF
ncbi:hypothetical protein TcYC6_0104670 [Trypanosoma cruzi]|nr:hypothetical protein TcYC6_0104650 [Trypanosoma cruzi]KAF8293952.1 hypothetical protein TcYC6_0104670 [Trypanosoma cruzi]RNC52091.1 Tbingi protein [Trypanosoma cruzi]